MIVHFDLGQLSRADAFSGLTERGGTGFSVDVFGVTEAMHDHHTAAPGSFRRLVLGLRRARAQHIPFGLVFRVTRSNYRHTVEVVRVAHTLGARALGLAPADASCPVPAPLPELAAPFVERAFETARSLDLPIAEAERAQPESAREWFEALGLGAVTHR